MAYIYKITNDINNKVYIGKTTNTVEKRWQEHCRDMNRKRCEKRPLYNAMNKYGASHFHIETVEKCDINSLSEREQFWISYYDSYHNGYNATYGGDGKPYVDGQAIIILWNKGKNLKEIHDITGYSDKTIRIYLNDYGITAEERQDRGSAWLRKPVAMIDKDTNEVLKVFATTSETEDFLQKPLSHRHVAEVCKGKRKTAYGYKWKYLSDL